MLESGMLSNWQLRYGRRIGKSLRYNLMKVSAINKIFYWRFVFTASPGRMFPGEPRYSY